MFANLAALLVPNGTGVVSKSFTITNNYEHTVWLGIQSSAGSMEMDTTGFVLEPGESRALSVLSRRERHGHRNHAVEEVCLVWVDG